MSDSSEQLRLLVWSSNGSAAAATASWLTGRGLAAEIESLRWAVDGDPIPAPGVREAVESLTAACGEACNGSDALRFLAAGDADDDAVAAGQKTADAIARAVEEAERWMRRLAQLCLGISVHLAGSDATAMAERAAVMAIVSSGVSLVDDGLWVASTSMVEFAPELAGWLCRVCVEHDCRLTFHDPEDPGRFSIEVLVDEVGNLELSCTFADPGLLPRAERRGWEREGDRLVSRWLDPFHPAEVAGLLIDTLLGECGITSPTDLALEIAASF